jgi:hypothetical protein
MDKSFISLLFKELQRRMGSDTLTDDKVEYYKDILDK